MQTYEVNDVVRLAVSLPEHDLVQGAAGAVVECFTRPNRAYEVEFVGRDGRTAVQLTLQADQLTVYEAVQPSKIGAAGA